MANQPHSSLTLPLDRDVVDKDFGSVPAAQAYWLAKRAQSVKSVVPSTYMKGMNAG